jgi:glutathione peroxidase
LGFPCNQFGKQEPGTNEEILAFAKGKYDVNFPMFAKIKVNGDNACELYRMLKDAQPTDEMPDDSSPTLKGRVIGLMTRLKKKSTASDISWNFAKFVVNRDGEVIKRFKPPTEPKDIEGFIESLL